MSSDVFIVLCTLPASDAGAQLARTLVEEKLAACVNLTPVRSLYSWEGKLCDDPEQLAVIKTTRERFDALAARILALHPYKCPEIVALPVQAGHEPYLAWVAASTR